MKMMQFFRRFARATGGQAALEFAILAPFVMVPLLLGSVDLLDLLQANRRAQNAAASIADVVSRATVVSNADVTSLWTAVDVLMYPNDASAVQTRITCVQIAADGRSAAVSWSVGHNGLTAYRPGTAITTLQPGMMRANTSIVMAETLYPYTSPLGFVSGGVMNLGHTAYRRSRLIDPIPLVP